MVASLSAEDAPSEVVQRDPLRSGGLLPSEEELDAGERVEEQLERKPAPEEAVRATGTGLSTRGQQGSCFSSEEPRVDMFDSHATRDDSSGWESEPLGDKLEVEACPCSWSKRTSMASVPWDQVSSSAFREAAGLTKTTQETFVNLSLPSENVLRATHAGAPLYRAGYIFRNRGTEGSFARGSGGVTAAGAADPYAMSFRVDHIQDFWSHSWHAPVPRKVATLLFVYNGVPAAVTGTVVALIGASLSATEVLPPMFHRKSEDGGELTMDYAVWAQAFGIVSFLVMLFTWWSRRTVFLDKVCIHQTDPALKQQGVESIGGFLRYSDFMLVIWDETYARRLWCIFEVAAFAKTHEANLTKRLRIVPVDLGPVLLAFFLVACWASILYMLTPPSYHFRMPVGFLTMVLGYSPCAWILRGYSRSLSILWKDLENFSVRSANCYCCSVRHKDPDTKAKLNCDRKVVEFCIVTWFGGLQPFERFVRKELLQHFRVALGTQGFQYCWAVLAMTPLMWWQAETVCAHLRAHDVDLNMLTILTVNTLAAWLCNGPLAVAVIKRLAGEMLWLRDHWAVDLAVSVFGALCGGGVTWSVAKVELHASEISIGLFLAVVTLEALLTLAVYSRAASRCLRRFLCPCWRS